MINPVSGDFEVQFENFEQVTSLANSGTLTKSKGLYAWIDKVTKEPVYVGAATGINGLRGRIHSQHLNPNYLEYRPSVHNHLLDDFQLQHAVVKTVIAGRIIKGIDKSVFRREIGRTYKKKPGSQTVNHIKENYILFIKVVINKACIIATEKELIVKYRPILNTKGKDSSMLHRVNG